MGLSLLIVIVAVVFTVWVMALKYATNIGNFIYKYIIEPILDIFK